MKTGKDARRRLEELQRTIANAFERNLIESDDFKATQTYRDHEDAGYTVESMLVALRTSLIPQILEMGAGMNINLPLPCVNDDLAAISYAEQVIDKAALDSWTLPSLVAAIMLFKELEQIYERRAARASGEASALWKFAG